MRRALAFVRRLAAWWALAGGAALLAVASMTVASIAARNLGPGPIPGDFELAGLGAAIAFFAGLPWCCAQRGHVTVSLAGRWLPRRAARLLDAAGSVAMGLAAALLAWRLALGGVDLRAYGETTMILALPLWWAFPPIVFSLALLAAVAFLDALAGDDEGEGA